MERFALVPFFEAWFRCVDDHQFGFECCARFSDIFKLGIDVAGGDRAYETRNGAHQCDGIELCRE